MSQRDTWKVGILGTAGYMALSLVLSVIVPGDQSQVASATRQSNESSLLLTQRSRSRKEIPEKQQIDKIELSVTEEEAVEVATQVVAVAAQETAVAEAEEKYHSDNWWLPKTGQRSISGLTTCGGGGCHAGSKPNPVNPEDQDTTGLNPLEAALAQKSGGWILGNEITTWVREDKHAQAYTVLLNDRSKEMAKIMGTLDANGESAIHRDKRCLACHASFPLEQLPTEQGNPHLITEQFVKTASLNFDTGVNCEGCHGPAGAGMAGSGWLGPHRDVDKWRYKNADEKFNEQGFWDVRDLVTRTKICVSCHVGNAGQGKVVTHEMYAAGHPPLPGFEIATFIHQEPQHWRDFGAKAQKVQDEYLEKTGEKFDAAAANKTTAAMVASLVTLGDSLRLSADLIDDQAAFPEAGIPKPSWPELANFACFNCHHDLRASSWRQKRTTGLTPGRPNIHEWPLANVAVAVKMAGKDKEFWAAYAKVQESIDKTPFGGKEFQDNARVVAGWLDNLGREWSKAPIKREDMPAILLAICDVALDEHMDYDSTRQLIWMFSSVYREWKSPTKVGDLPPSFTGWYDQNELDDIEKILAGMSDHVLLDLKAGRKSDKRTLNGIDRDTIEVDATKILPKIADFDPQTAVRDSFGQLKKLLSKGE